MDETVDVCIVGGGISGLACAAWLRLAAPTLRLAVLEATDAPGGKMQTGTDGDWRFELGPTTVLDNAPDTEELVERLGLAGDWLVADPANANRYLWKSGRRHALPGPPRTLWKALTTPVLSPAGKLRLACEPFVRAAPRASESLHDFARRRLGREAAASLLEPFACGIHAGDPADLEVQSAFPKLARAEREFGNLCPGMFKLARELRGGQPRRPARMRSFAAGLGALPEALTRFLGSESWRPRVRVETIEPTASGYLLRGTAAGQPRVCRARAVVLATPAGEAAALLRTLPPARDAAAALAGIRPNRLALAHLGVRAADVAAPLDGFGHLVVRGHGVRTLGLIYASSLFPGRAPPGHALLTAFVGGALDGAAVELGDAELLEFVVEDARRVLGLKSSPVWSRVIRWPEAFPRYQLGHAARMRRVEAAMAATPRIFLAGNYLGGLSVNDCIRTARQTAAGVVTSVLASTD